MFANWKRLSKSFVYASRGLTKVVREEQNFRLELLAGFLVLILALVLQVTRQELAILILAIGLVLCLEIVNSVAELISDAIRPKLDHYAKTIKDVVASGVLLASITALIIGIVIFSQYL
jgi:diacylglycerol kinase